MAQPTLAKLLERYGISRGDVSGLTPIRRTLYFKRRIANAAQAEEARYKYFHQGIDDGLTNFGYAAGNATRVHTNLQKGGVLNKGEVFICQGLAFETPRDLAAATFDWFRENDVAWHERGGTPKIPLGRVKEMPAVYGQNYLLDRGAATGEARERFREFGPAYFRPESIFCIRGGSAESDNGSLVVEATAAYTVPTEFVHEAQLFGILLTNTGVRR